jgi:hypothetical protein
MIECGQLEKNKEHEDEKVEKKIKGKLSDLLLSVKMLISISRTLKKIFCGPITVICPKEA